MNQKEPVVFGALVLTTVNAVMALVLALGIDVSSELQAAIVGIVNIIVVWIVALRTRSLVYAPYTVQQAMKPSPEDTLPPPTI